MYIFLNGERQQLSNSTNIKQLLDTLSLSEKRLAVSVNGDLVPRAQHSAVHLQENDQVELIQAVGGG